MHYRGIFADSQLFIQHAMPYFNLNLILFAYIEYTLKYKWLSLGTNLQISRL